MSTFVALVNNDATIFSSKVLISEAYAKHSQMLTDHLYLQSLPHIMLYIYIYIYIITCNASQEAAEGSENRGN